MASSGVFYLIELETDGWGYWSENKAKRKAKRPSPRANGWMKERHYRKNCASHQKKWVGKERFLKVGISTNRHNMLDSYKRILDRYKKENIKVLNKLYYLEIETHNLRHHKYPRKNHRKVEKMFMEKFKDKFDYSPTKWFGGWTECFTIDLKKEKKMLDNFVEKVIKEFV